MHKQILITLTTSVSIVLLLLLSACQYKNHTQADKTLYEYWYASLPDNWEVCYQIHSANDSIIGKSVTYLNGMQYITESTGEISIINDSVMIVVNPAANIVFKGKYDETKHHIIGGILSPDGTINELTLEKIDARYQKAFNPRENTKEPLSPEKIKKLNDGIPVSNLEKVALSRRFADTLMQKILNRELGEIHAVLIAKDGKLVFEEYFYDYDLMKKHRLHSCTKSIVSLLIGNENSNELLLDLQNSIPQAFPFINSEITNQHAKLKLEDVLGMTSGLSEIKFHPASNNAWIDSLLSTPINFNPGEQFEYNDFNSHLIGYLISKASNAQLDEYAKRVLFNPLGISDYHWERFDDYTVKANTGLALRARDLLKIGLLVLNKGSWKDKQIVNSEWIDYSTAFRRKVFNSYNYGLHWWNIDGNTMNLDKNYPLAQGDGGQRLYILPSENIACVVYGGNFNSWHPLDTYLKNIILQKE